MLLYLALFGIIISGILLYFNANRDSSNIYFGLFLFMECLFGFSQYAILYSKSEFLISIFFVNAGFLGYLIGPLLYWYVRSVVTFNDRLTRRDLVHLIPLLIYMVAELPYLFTPFVFKTEIARSIVNDAGFLVEYKATFLSDLFGNAFIYLSRPLLVLGYTIYSIVIYIRFRVRNRRLNAISNQRTVMKWISILLGIQFFIMMSHLLTLFHTFIFRIPDLDFTLSAIKSISVAGLSGVLLSVFFFPSIIYGLQRFSNLASFESISTCVGESGFEKKLIKRDHNFDSEYSMSIAQKVEFCIMEDQPYLRPNFDLQQFSVLIQVPVHHLGYFFKEIKKQSFNDFRNEWRIDHAKSLMAEGKAHELTLEAIGLKCGFANRLTFFRVFMKIEGISPSAFLASMQVAV